MKIRNHTHWRTRQLRGLILRALREQEKIEGPLKTKKYLVVDIRYRRPGGNYGRGSYGGGWMALYIERDSIDVHQLADTIWHESWHLRGWRHRDCARSPHSFGKLPADAVWWQEYRVEKQIEPIKPTRDLQAERYLKVVDRLEDKQSRLKRLQNQVKKLVKQKNYYEKKMAAKKQEGESHVES